ncbi:MAG: DUF3887 domain-containing protein [Hadesarchaea archaeon]|nr:DUF3887 domain-containing protein [Hadesarchaea archaeon]
MRAKIGLAISIIAIVIIIGAIYAIYFAGSQGTDLEAKARDFVLLLKEGRFDEAHGLFNEQMVAAISVDQLEAIWNGVIGEVGGYKGITGTRVATESGYQVVYVTTEFERASLDVKVVFDGASKVAGLWFFPKG